jgi:hypothetical protein
LFAQKHLPDPGLTRKEGRWVAKQTEENDRGTDNEARYECFQSIANKYSVDSPLLTTLVLKDKTTMTELTKDKTTMTELTKDIRAGHVQGTTAHTELDLCFAFQRTLSAKFSEMLLMHREIMLELMSKERGRDEQMQRLTLDLSQLHLTNARLQMENRHICDMLAKHKDLS